MNSLFGPNRMIITPGTWVGKYPRIWKLIVCRSRRWGDDLSNITVENLNAALTGNPEALEVHLELVERDVVLDGHQVKIHCHCLTVDANGRVDPHRLAEFMRHAVTNYAIPRARMADAKARDEKWNSGEAVAALHEEAKRSFTDLALTGEGGEMLLFLLAERFLKLPQILCKMDLKTDTRLHYHGADGVYAGVTDDGILKLFWGESKVYKDVGDGIKECFASIAPFLIEPDHEGAEREKDLILLSDKADLSDPIVTAALRQYFNKDSKQSKRVRYCGIALIGYDAAYYPADGVKGIAEDIAKAAKAELEKLKAHSRRSRHLS